MNLNIGNIIDLTILLLEGVTKQTPTEVDDLAVAGIKRAIAELLKVHGTPVTKVQVESLRVDQVF
jgi:hypothetical protein